MEPLETKSSSGYAKPPWLFKGSALYQLHLVKAATARAFIPKEFRLVEAFGYTLGGFFLAHYDDSPVGMFDELVVIAGIVWNPPTSCAWAARVLVNNHEACLHGRKAVGLPSQVARFSKKITSTTEKHGDKSNNFLSMLGVGTALSNSKGHMDIEVTEVEDGSAEANFCNIKLQPSDTIPVKTPCSDVMCLSFRNFVITMPPESSSVNSWMGPGVKMSLPSFSGNTEYNPQLLKYSCQIECRVRPVKTAKISGPIPIAINDEEKLSDPQNTKSIDSEITRLAEKDSRERSISVLLSKPLLALQFNFLKMQVEAPTVLADHSRMK